MHARRPDAFVHVHNHTFLHTGPRRTRSRRPSTSTSAEASYGSVRPGTTSVWPQRLRGLVRRRWSRQQREQLWAPQAWACHGCCTATCSWACGRDSGWGWAAAARRCLVAPYARGFFLTSSSTTSETKEYDIPETQVPLSSFGQRWYPPRILPPPSGALPADTTGSELTASHLLRCAEVLSDFGPKVLLQCLNFLIVAAEMDSTIVGMQPVLSCSDQPLRGPSVDIQVALRVRCSPGDLRACVSTSVRSTWRSIGAPACALWACTLNSVHSPVRASIAVP